VNYQRPNPNSNPIALNSFNFKLRKQGGGAIAPTPFQPLNLKHKPKTFRYPHLELKAANVPDERLQVTFATPPRSLNSPLQPGC
jgi:hypothetical protein